jgi:cyclopropane fatty-acyl-phospholipid synthase-like methyltransferase
VSEARWRFTTIAHATHRILGPLATDTVERALTRAAYLDQGAAGLVLDVGCGKGELLLRAHRHLGGAALGIEPNPAFAAAALERAREWGLSAHVTIEECRWQDLPAPPAGVSLAICTGSVHAFGSIGDALQALHSVVAPGGLALLAPGYWKREPAAEYLAGLGSTRDEQDDWDGTLARAEGAGWRVRHAHASTRGEWEDYERAYAANVNAWCTAHPDDPDAPAFAERIASWSALVERHGLDTLGYALLLLQRG